jgi:hypothetical protein
MQCIAHRTTQAIRSKQRVTLTSTLIGASTHSTSCLLSILIHQSFKRRKEERRREKNRLLLILSLILVNLEVSEGVGVFGGSDDSV